MPPVIFMFISKLVFLITNSAFFLEEFSGSFNLTLNSCSVAFSQIIYFTEKRMITTIINR